MRKFNKTTKLTVSVISIALGFFGLIAVYAATSPSFGISSTFGILSSTFTNGSAGTVINGDVGYTVAGAPVTPAVVNGTIYPEDATFTAAGIAQGAALASLNAQACTFTFPAGAVNLATETTHVPAHGSVVGEYYPGVYCTTATSAASIGTAGITLNGAGTYIFRIDGALTTVVNSHVTVSNGASACDVFWTPTEAATIGAGGSTNINFKGTVIDAAGITISEGVKWIGRALAFGGTVTVPLANVEITVPTCILPNLTVVKQVSGGGPKVAADFPLFVGATPVVSGVTNAYPAGSYVVSETTDSNYTQTFSGSCPNGDISLATGNSYTCTIINTYITPPVAGGSVGLQFLPQVNNVADIPIVIPRIGVTKTPIPTALYSGPGLVTYNYVVWNDMGVQPLVSITLVDDKCSTMNFISGDINIDGKLNLGENWKYNCTTTLTSTTTNTVVATGYSDDPSRQKATASAVATVPVSIPGLPNTGLPSQNKNAKIVISLLFSILGIVSLFYITREKKNI